MKTAGRWLTRSSGAAVLSSPPPPRESTAATLLCNFIIGGLPDKSTVSDEELRNVQNVLARGAKRV